MISYTAIMERRLKKPDTFPEYFEYQVMKYLSASDLLIVSSVAKKWHEHAMAVFWYVVPRLKTPVYLNPDQINKLKDELQKIVWARKKIVWARNYALTKIVACPNAYSISRIDNLLKEGAQLSSLPQGNLGPYGAAVVKHIIEKDPNYDKYASMTNNPLILAFIKQHRALHGKFDSYVMDETEMIIVCLFAGFGVIGVPAIILCALLASPLNTIALIGAILIPGCLSLSCICSASTTIQLLGLSILISSAALAFSGGITLMLASLVGTIPCGISLATLGVAAGIYLIVDFMKMPELTPEMLREREQIKRDADEFTRLAKSANCLIDPQPISTFSGGLFNNIWSKIFNEKNMPDAPVSGREIKICIN